MKEYTLWVIPHNPAPGDKFGIRVTVGAKNKLAAIEKILFYVPGSITA